jgi:hypothetical protein
MSCIHVQSPQGCKRLCMFPSPKDSHRLPLSILRKPAALAAFFRRLELPSLLLQTATSADNSMAFELGFDPFNFIVAVLGLVITATHLLTNRCMHGQVGRPTARSCGLQATLPLPATSRHCRKKQNRLFMHFAMWKDSWYGREVYTDDHSSRC